MYSEIFTVIAPIFIITGVGFALGRINTEIDTRGISTVVLLVATPCLVFSTLTSLEIELATLGRMALAATCCIVIAGLFAFAILRLVGLPIRTFLTSLALPNSGNIGLPLVLLAFGDTGLVLGISYFFVVALFQYTVGASIISGQYKYGEVIRQPLVWSILLVLVVVSTGVDVPVVIAKSTEIMGGLMIPAMLIMLGISLAQLTVSDLGPALFVAIARLLIGIAAGLIVIVALSLSGVEAGVVFLLATMPTAIVNYVFAERYRPDAPRVAGAVVVSTLFTFALLPALLWLTYWIAGQAPQ